MCPDCPIRLGAMRDCAAEPDRHAAAWPSVVRPDDRVGIVFSDITRATPHGLILPAVLAELRHVPPEQITLCCALGTHRPNTQDELRSMFAMAGTPEIAEELLSAYRVVQNDSFDPDTQQHMGVTSRGHDIWLNREIAACDVKVLTGFYRAALLCRLLGRRQGADARHGRAAYGAGQP